MAFDGEPRCDKQKSPNASRDYSVGFYRPEQITEWMLMGPAAAKRSDGRSHSSDTSYDPAREGIARMAPEWRYHTAR